jgi:hypothetical protein
MRGRSLITKARGAARSRLHLDARAIASYRGGVEALAPPNQPTVDAIELLMLGRAHDAEPVGVEALLAVAAIATHG